MSNIDMIAFDFRSRTAEEHSIIVDDIALVPEPESYALTAGSIAAEGGSGMRARPAGRDVRRIEAKKRREDVAVRIGPLARSDRTRWKRGG